LGRDQQQKPEAANGRLMPGRPPETNENLLLIAATAIAVLTLQRWLQPVSLTPSLPNPSADPARRHQALPSGDVIGAELSRPGHGRLSSNPFQIPWAGWKDILWRTYVRTGEDRLLAIAAGVVFFGLLAVFPAITALVSCYGLFADPATIGANLQTLALMLPQGSFQVVEDQVARVLMPGNTALGVTFLFGLGLAIWSANAGVKAVIDALNVVYEEREKRSFIRLNLLSMAFTIGGIAALLLMVGAVVAAPLALDHVGLAPESQLIVRLARWPLLLFILLTALSLIYRFGPSRRPARWEWLSVGALAAALLWIAGSFLLSWYLSNFANYNATYGSLGAAIGLMMWMWMSAIIVLCGAELNSEIEHQTALDSTIGRAKPMGYRGARMADTLGQRFRPWSKNTSHSNQQ
jgi:membrane protein